ncbi:mfs transporter [Ophiostoma piceae UAMH 11346]|uniref:Mfs transporter n=1 Tax=Ophiostoma piceae (strain UAMH 11346) TaxID=1262450 RepID=S3BS49_OPHP1|nr:mfs transporter [Ophiostoma piceae UAMH 11346]
MERTSHTSAPGSSFPRRQLQVLLACRLVEPLAINSVIPYLFQMVRHVSSPDLSDGEATRLVTLIFSAYAMAQFSTNILWGRLSDRIGRRPVLLFGLAGVFVSTVALAFSSSVPLIFVSRIAAGLLCGNIVITRTMIGDMVHGRENKSRAFAWNQTVYQIGTVVGPFIGGFFVQPFSREIKASHSPRRNIATSYDKRAGLRHLAVYHALQVF